MESATKYSRRNIWRASQHGHASVGCDHWELKQDGSYRPVRKSAARAEQTPEPGAAPISLEWARAKSELAAVSRQARRQGFIGPQNALPSAHFR